MSPTHLEMIAILTELRLIVEASKASDWAALTPLEVIAILDREIASLRVDERFNDLALLESLFVPTGELQEISMAGGWGNRYLALADRFDGALTRCR